MRLGTQAVAGLSSTSPRRWSHRIVQAAAAVVVLLLGGAAFLRSPSQAWDAYGSSKATLRNVTLADGSLVQLDHDSIVAVHFDAERRRIDVAPGMLTPHGVQRMTALGGRYRKLWAMQGYAPGGSGGAGAELASMPEDADLPAGPGE